MKTLRARLLIGTALGTGLVLSAFALVLYMVVRAALWAEFDAALGSKTRSLAALVEQEGDELDLDLDEIGLAEFMPSKHAEYYQLWTAGGRVLARSASLGGCDLERIDGSTNSPVYRSMKLPDGRPGRLVGMTFVPRRGIENEEEEVDNDHGHRGESPQGSSGERLVVTLVVGRDSVEIDMTLGRLRLLLVCGCTGAMLASVGVLSWFVRRGLKPLGHLATEIASIGETNLSNHLETDDAPSELFPIITRLNELLIRLETAFAREKGLTADVAHELRTPLAGLRSTLEVSLSKQRAANSYQEAMAKSLAICQQMQRMVENLLELARADASQLEMTSESVDLVELLRECWTQFADRAVERQLEVTLQLPESCPLITDRTKVRLVLNNVLDNATTYTNAGGRITIALHSESGQANLRVENTGSQIAETDAELVFDRFWRGDVARTTEGNGRRYGLGLPLCQKLITLLGGSVSVRTTSGGTFAISIILFA